jgi:hypothetical protein
MKSTCAFALIACAFSLGTFGQSNVPTFKAEARSAFVWGEDTPAGAVSSTIQDPLTGNDILKLSYAGIEVSSRMGFEKVSTSETGDFLGWTTTIVNATDSRISVRHGGISVDGHLAALLFIVPADKNRNKAKFKNRKDVVELPSLYCFTSGFLSSENLFFANESSQVYAVDPGTALSVSSVIRDPRNYSIRCSVGGCYPTGTIRYCVRVNSRDYIFVWPGRSAVSCGK